MQLDKIFGRDDQARNFMISSSSSTPVPATSRGQRAARASPYVTMTTSPGAIATRSPAPGKGTAPVGQTERSDTPAIVVGSPSPLTTSALTAPSLRSISPNYTADTFC